MCIWFESDDLVENFNFDLSQQPCEALMRYTWYAAISSAADANVDEYILLTIYLFIV